jgi:hypothetical protein
VTAPRLTWRISEAGAATVVELSGQLDEQADLALLKPLLAGAVELHLGGITRINSTGVRTWVNFIHDLPSVRELAFTHCSPAIVTQLNTIYNFRGRARVRSLLAPYQCESCGAEERKLIELQAGAAPPSLPPSPCARCGGTMEFDDLPERYLSFLREGA